MNPKARQTLHLQPVTVYTILKWLALAVLITRGRGSISHAPSLCRGGFWATRKQLRYAPVLDAKLNVFCHTILSKAMVSCIIFSFTEQIVCTEAIINFNVLNSQCKCMIYTLSSRVKFPAVQ